MVRYNIPVYIILKKFSYDHEADMIGYSFDKDDALGKMHKEALKYANDIGGCISIPDFNDDLTILEVGHYTFMIEERGFEV